MSSPLTPVTTYTCGICKEQGPAAGTHSYLNGIRVHPKCALEAGVDIPRCGVCQNIHVVARVPVGSKAVLPKFHGMNLCDFCARNYGIDSEPIPDPGAV